MNLAEQKSAAWQAYEAFLDLVHRDRANGWVYFISDGIGSVKVGKSRSPWRRLCTLRSGSAQELSLIGVIPGYSLVEFAAHKVLQPVHLRGEWFKDSELLRDFMTLHCDLRGLAACLVGA